MKNIEYKDLISKIVFLSRNVDTNKVIMREYYRRLERDVNNFLSGDTKKSMMDIVEQIKFGLVDPIKTMNEFIENNNENMTNIQKITLTGDIEKINSKLKDSDKDLIPKIKPIITMIQNYSNQSVSKINKKNIYKYFYNVVDNKLRGTISYKNMTKILKWSLNKVNNN